MITEELIAAIYQRISNPEFRHEEVINAFNALKLIEEKLREAGLL